MASRRLCHSPRHDTNRGYCMRLFELFDNPLSYRRMGTSVNVNHNSKGFVYGFRVSDFWYKVWINVYPVNRWLAISKDRAEDAKIPAEFEKIWDRYIMSIDFAQYNYKERAVPYKSGPIPGGTGDSREGREGTGNELQVFATVAAIAQEVYQRNKDKIGVVEYGAKDDDPKRKRLYASMLRKYGITGKIIEIKMATEAGGVQDRVYNTKW